MRRAAMKVALALVCLAGGAAALLYLQPKRASSSPAADSTHSNDVSHPEGDGLRIVPPLIEFGHRWIGDPCEAAMSLRNDGAAPLTARPAATSCGCVTAFDGEIVLDAGKQHSIPVRVDTSGKSPGEFRGTISMEVKRGNERKDVQVAILATLARRGELQCSPRVLVVGQISPCDRVSATFDCWCRSGDGRLSGSARIVDGPDWLEAWIVSRDREKFTVAVEGIAPRRTGVLTGSLRLAIGDHVNTLPIQGAICSELAFDAGNVVKVLSPDQPALERLLPLRHASGGKFDVTAVKYEGSHADLVTVDSVGTNHRAEIRLIVQPTTAGSPSVVRGSVVASCLVDGKDIEVALPVVVVRR